MRFQFRTLAAAALFATACGGGDDGPTNPTPSQVLGSITATPGTLPLTAGSTGSITVQALDETGAVISGATGFTYVLSDNTVAEVSASGSVLALKAGPTDVTVSLTRGGVTKTAVVHVTVTGTLPSTASISAGTNLAFSPDRVVIAAGGTVTFSAGAVEHNVTFDGGNGAPSNIPTGASWQFNRTFPIAGDFGFQCTLHPGMNGTVLVR
jgi:plastocyanin